MVTEYSLSTMSAIPGCNRKLNAEANQRLVAVRAAMTKTPLLPDAKPQHQRDVPDKKDKQADANGCANPTILLGVTVNVTTQCRATDQTTKEENNPNRAAFAGASRHLSLLGDELLFCHGRSLPPNVS